MYVLSYSGYRLYSKGITLGLTIFFVLITGIIQKSPVSAELVRDKKDPHLQIKDLEKGCFECHPQIPQSCFLTVTPKIYNILKIQMPEFPLPLSYGRITCTSCHWIRATEVEEKRPYRLKIEYDAYKEMAEKIEPHKTGVFCFLCHTKEPRQKDGPLYLKYDKDTVRLCKECHDNKRARADNHPVDVVPSKERMIKIPEDFPLSDGRVTCVTCHQIKCQGEKKNPLFLRGGPYRSRIEVCLLCHVKDQYKKDNPHDQIAENGDIREDRCLFCHAVETDEKGEKKIGFKFKAPFRLYCIGCHPVEVRRHPFGAHHAGRYIESIWAGISMEQRTKISHNQSFKITPVSLSGQVMCTSCHNPHDNRPGPKLRISDVNTSCRQCHFRHYGLESFTGGPKKGSTPGNEDMTPEGEDMLPFGYRASLRFYCIGCHPNKEKKHPYGVDHNGKFIRRFWKHIPYEKRARLSKAETSQIIPLTTSGQVSCFTCHDPHDGRKGNKLRLNEMDLLCSLCHIDRSIIIKSFKEKGN